MIAASSEQDVEGRRRSGTLMWPARYDANDRTRLCLGSSTMTSYSCIGIAHTPTICCQARLAWSAPMIRLASHPSLLFFTSSLFVLPHLHSSPCECGQSGEESCNERRKTKTRGASPRSTEQTRRWSGQRTHFPLLRSALYPAPEHSLHVIVGFRGTHSEFISRGMEVLLSPSLGSNQAFNVLCII